MHDATYVGTSPLPIGWSVLGIIPSKTSANFALKWGLFILCLLPMNTIIKVITCDSDSFPSSNLCSTNLRKNCRNSVKFSARNSGMHARHCGTSSGRGSPGLMSFSRLSVRAYCTSNLVVAIWRFQLYSKSCGSRRLAFIDRKVPIAEMLNSTQQCYPFIWHCYCFNWQ